MRGALGSVPSKPWNASAFCPPVATVFFAPSVSSRILPVEVSTGAWNAIASPPLLLGERRQSGAPPGRVDRVEHEHRYRHRPHAAGDRGDLCDLLRQRLVVDVAAELAVRPAVDADVAK